MKYKDLIKLTNQLGFFLFTVCYMFLPSKLFIACLAFFMLIHTGYWIYLLAVYPKERKTSVLIILGLDISILAVIAHSYR